MAYTGSAGRDGANRELKNRLKATLARQGLSQADIVRQTQLNGESVSKAAVSNALNPEKGPPVALTIGAILNAAGISGTERDELFRLHDRAESHGTTQLEAYLEAAEKAARQHSYPGVIGAPNPPALADVYVHQQARTPAADNEAAPAVPAAEVFGEDRALCVLLGGPGVGKSTLLRAHLAGWMGAMTGKTIPVMVSASALTGTDPLPTALAKAVTGDLRQVGLLDELGADFFRHPPRPGVSWLVLVDGLDEIPDTDTRSAALTMLAGAASAGPGLYRFVVATRHLPVKELGALGRHVPHYELQPFSPHDLLAYAAHWFRDLDDPSRHANAFMAGLKRSHLETLAHTPLMAFMLCQLYAADPARPLPDGRTGVYQSFVELIYEQNAHKNIKSTHDEAIRRLKDRYQIPKDNLAAEQATRQVRDHLPELIDHLAYERINGSNAPAVDILASHLQASRPQKVKPHLWNSFLTDLLRPTGILAQRADDFDFLHQTLLEYHAARHATRDEDASSQVLRDLFPLRFDADGDSWEPPNLEPSYLGFLIDRLLTHQDSISKATTQAMERVTSVAFCFFLARQVQLGTSLPTHITARHLNHFVNRLTDEGHMRVNIVSVLARVEGQRDHAAGLLVGFAHDTDLDEDVRVHAAQTLAKVDGHREHGIELLTALTTESILSGHGQVAAVRALAEITSARLTALANDSTVDSYTRLSAAKALAEVDGHHEHGAELLAALTTTLEGYDRVDAAWSLTRIEGHREHGAALLASLTTDTALAARLRLQAAQALIEVDTHRDHAVELLAALTTDTTMSPHDRIGAASALARVDGHREHAAALLTTLTTDITLPLHSRMGAARKLAGFDGYGQQAADVLAACANDTTLDDRTRVHVAWDLARADGCGKRGAALLAALSADTTLDEHKRVEAARFLTLVDEHQQHGTVLLAALTADTTLSKYGQVAAVRALAEGAAEYASEPLAACAVDTSLDGYTRVDAARALAGMDRREALGAELLAALTTDAALDIADRVGAARALAELDGHQDQAAELLTTLTIDSTLGDYGQGYAAEALSEVNWGREHADTPRWGDW
ncbi:hypothetical protein [Streptomyces sp. ME19-01-6]|uniref:NACHT domain-containing protein n=1 Tax=Streptomyces sp. ME19-01-6 TaxID=3028686 RepID=UPI0029A5CC52|nr:hypothetical protein [Streptomyces sp. ME19-01-6]MDX3225448.1 hypothetical protein [Streptomyces sp. ME19-01-6]